VEAKLNFLKLALKNITGDSFTTIVAVVCVAIVAGVGLLSTVLTRGTEASLRLALERLGADIIVMPEGMDAKIESALLMGKPVMSWMPDNVAGGIRQIPGVAIASPQFFLASMKDASCCTASEMFMVAFDSETDFTIRPWLERKWGKKLDPGEAVGGAFVFVPAGDQYIRLYGYNVDLVGTLEPTGTGLDQTMFFTFETAYEMAKFSVNNAEAPMDVPPGRISAVMVKLSPGADPAEVAESIMGDVKGVMAIRSSDFFRAFRRQMAGMGRSAALALGLTWALALIAIGIAFSVAVNSRRREIGVMRALGGTSNMMFASILAEASILAIGGGIVGLGLAIAGIYLFHDLVVNLSRMPFLLPSLSDLLLLSIGELSLAVVSVGLAAMVSAVRVSRQEPAISMRR
jgi:putative ABC transport system permease protein